MMRGGTASVFEKRKVNANNPYMNEKYNPQEKTSYGFMLDANNLYGGVMQIHKLPARDFELIHVKEDGEVSTSSETSLDEILAFPEDSDIGFILEVDLEYPQELHESHQDYPLAPTREAVPEEWLSDYQRDLAEQMKSNDNYRVAPGKVKKLLQTLHNKSNYTVHYKLLQLYVRLGLKITKVHRVLKFKQELWLEPYITLNTNKRKAARNKFEEALFKLLNNSAYGKTCESKRKRVKVNFVHNAEETMQQISAFDFKTFKIFGDDLAVLTSAPRVINWNVPIIVGACVLEIAKFEIMKPNFDCRLLYSYTDNLLYEIETEKNADLYEILKNKSNIIDEFDFSNYSENHPLFNKQNKLTVLKYKDEFSADTITDFIALKPKLYSIISLSEYFQLLMKILTKKLDFFFQFVDKKIGKSKNFPEIFFSKIWQKFFSKKNPELYPERSWGSICQSGGALLVPIRKSCICQSGGVPFRRGPDFANPEGSVETFHNSQLTVSETVKIGEPLVDMLK